MGVLHNPLGMNLTNQTPVKDSPFVEGFSDGSGGIVPGDNKMITEITLDFMLTEDSSGEMILE